MKTQMFSQKNETPSSELPQVHMCSLIFLREKMPQAPLPSHTGKPPDVWFLGEQLPRSSLEGMVLSRAIVHELSMVTDTKPIHCVKHQL